MNDNINLDDLRVATPCHARWEDMAGTERARFCGQCSKNVFNLSAMTRAEIERLIKEKEGKFCGRFYRRPDGRMLTADCPTGKLRRRNRLVRWCALICGTVMFWPGLRSLVLAQEKLKSGVTNTEPGRLMGEMDVRHARMGEMAMPTNLKMGKICVPPAATNRAPVLMGIIVMPLKTNQAPPLFPPKK